MGIEWFFGEVHLDFGRKNLDFFIRWGMFDKARWLSHNPEKTEHLQHSFANVYIKTYSQPGAFANPLKN